MGTSSQGIFPIFEEKEPAIGYVETETLKAIETLRETGLLGGESAGMVALAVIAARNVDRMGDRGAPSGRANLISSAKDCLESLIPEVKADVSTQRLQEVLTAIRDEPVDDDLPEFTTAEAV